MTDGELLERFVTARDEAAFEGLVRRHGPMVLGLCRRALRDNHDAEDAFQATFLVLVRNAQTIRKRDSLASWLYGVALRVTRKAQVGARQRELVHHGEATVAIGPETDDDRFELRPILHDEVDRLPDKYRAPVVLCYFEGQSHEEAARQLDWPVGTVKGRLSRARGILQSRLVRRGLALSLGLVAFLEDEATAAAVPETLVESTVQSAMMTKTIAAFEPAADPKVGRLRSTLSGRKFWLVMGLLLALAGLAGRTRLVQAVDTAGQAVSSAAATVLYGSSDGSAAAPCHTGR